MPAGRGMRIAFFSDNFYPEISGISESIITTGSELQKRGHEVLYVAPWYPESAYEPGRDPERDRLRVVRLPSVPFFNSPTGQARVALPIGASYRVLRAFEPDVIHTQSPYGTGLEALRAARRVGAALVGTNHTPISEFIRYLPIHGSLAIQLAQRYESWYYNHCTITTAPYAGLLDEMRRFGFRGEGWAQPNPLPITAGAAEPEERVACRRELRIDGSMILVSGRLAPEKKVDVIFRAFARALPKLPDATLVVTGHGSNEALLRRLAATLGIAGHVRFVGFVSVRDLDRLNSAADVYVVMSTAETQSLALMQAFAHGVPAVAARSRGLAAYMCPEAGRLVEPGDVDALAGELVDLLGSDNRRVQMGRAGVEFVKQFSPCAVAVEWERVFERVRRR
jgi:1,2-diacylglycerol 3-alpha-glucosyltransferase